MADNLQHEDFGEKIGGAKKDLWKDRGLYVDDLGGMNEREAEKFVKKDNVWKKPDYQVFNTINFSKSMHYNPFAYIHNEKDILKLVTVLIANTKGARPDRA